MKQHARDGAMTSFCAAVNCMDGRVQLPVIEYLREQLGVTYVDMITEAGPVRALAGPPDDDVVLSIVSRIGVSTGKHGSTTVAVVAHDDCAGNPVGESEQLEQVARSVDLVADRFPATTVIGLWVDDTWAVREIVRRKPATTEVR